MNPHTQIIETCVYWCPVSHLSTDPLHRQQGFCKPTFSCWSSIWGHSI